MNGRQARAKRKPPTPTDPPQQPTRQLRTVEIALHPDPMQVREEIPITAARDEHQIRVMLRDNQGVWHAIVLPSGSEWVLKPKGRGLWLPGMQQ